MSTLVLLEVTAKPECVDAVKEFFRKHLPDTRKYDGCQDVSGYEHEDGGTIIQVQRWDSKEHYQKYLAQRVESGVLAELESLLDGNPSIRFFDPIDV